MPEFNWISDDLFTVAEFFSAGECEAYIHLSESLGFGEAPISTVGGPVMLKEVRDNARVMLDDPALAEVMWGRARPYVPALMRGHQACGVMIYSG
jgi:hypothetical protein